MGHILLSGPRSRALLTTVVMAAAALGGCGGQQYTDYEHFQVAPSQSYRLKPYVIEPPDVIRIISPNAPEIDNVSQQLRPDGYITLHLVGDVLAADKTPKDLAQEIEEKIRDFYEDVSVQVRVSNFNSKFYYIAGESRSGPVSYTGNDTVFSAVMRAGLPRSAWPEKAVVIRPNEDGDLIRRMSVDLNAMIEKGDFRHNAVLEEGDIVFVPINPLAAVGVAIQNLLSPVSPALQAIATPARVTATPLP